MGSGRRLELKDYMEAAEADLIIFDEELSPAQLRNIEELCDCPVLDRTMLILDIFAARAVSGEGTLQVELARLQYQLPRLAGRGVQLSRQGGGGAGGTGARRGAGETKLEVDRRHIRRRIDALKTELAALARRREQRRARRKKDGGALLSVYFAVRRSEQDVYVKSLLACWAYNGVRPPLYRKAQLCMTRGAAAESVCLYFLYLSSEVTKFTGDCIPYFQEAAVFCLTRSDVIGKHTEEQPYHYGVA